MAFVSDYAAAEPARTDVDAMRGPVVLEFGAPWCGYCSAAQPLIEAVLGPQPSVTHLKIEDGRGRPLGRSYSIKLWPTLLFLLDGSEHARVVRPHDAEPLVQALRQIVVPLAAG